MTQTDDKKEKRPENAPGGGSKKTIIIVAIVAIVAVLIAVKFLLPQQKESKPAKETSASESAGESAAKPEAAKPKAESSEAPADPEKEAAYKKASELVDKGDYGQAFQAFRDLGDYKDSKQLAERYSPKLVRKTTEGWYVLNHEYDANGRLTTVTWTPSSQSAQTPFRSIVETYQYDENGKKTEVVEVGESVTPEASYRKVSKFDDHGMMVSSETFPLNGDEKQPNKRETCEVFYGEDGKPESTILTVERFDPATKGFIEDQKVTATYANGLKTEEKYQFINTPKDQRGADRVKYQYDNHDQIVRITDFFDDPADLLKSTNFDYVHKYDQYGDVISTTSKLAGPTTYQYAFVGKDGKLIDITTDSTAVETQTANKTPLELLWDYVDMNGAPGGQNYPEVSKVYNDSGYEEIVRVEAAKQGGVGTKGVRFSYQTTKDNADWVLVVMIYPEDPYAHLIMSVSTQGKSKIETMYGKVKKNEWRDLMKYELRTDSLTMPTDRLSELMERMMFLENKFLKDLKFDFKMTDMGF